MDRHRIADALEEIALLLEMRGESPFKSRAYARAADLLRAFEGDLAALVRAGRLKTLPGIGDALAEKIAALHDTGGLPYLDELRAQVPQAAAIREFLQVPGLGIKKARLLAESLHAANLGELEYACRENRLLDLPGFGAKAQDRILQGIERLKGYRGRMLVSDALRAIEPIRDAVAALPGVRAVEIAGPLRRCRETVDALCLVAAGDPDAAAVARLASLPGLENGEARGPGRIEAVLRGAIPVRIAIVPEAEHATTLVVRTGSDGHVAALRRRAEGLGLRLDEAGLWRGPDRVPCPDERAVHRALGLEWIPPELRQDGGAVETAAGGALPPLVQAADLRGILHVHSTWSDGRLGIEEIVARSAAHGWEYVGISDHSRSARYARGLSVEALRRQQEEIDAARRRHPEIRVLKGSEVDILADGSLDYPDDVLAGLDFVVASVHSQFGLPRDEQTRRIVRALRHPRTTILGHPTGRLLLARDPYAVDLEEVLQTAAAEGVWVELNAHPQRLDLDTAGCRRAKALGARLSIDPDAHDAEGLRDVRWGVGVARRAGLAPSDILNTTPAARLDDVLRRRA